MKQWMKEALCWFWGGHYFYEGCGSYHGGSFDKCLSCGRKRRD